MRKWLVMSTAFSKLKDFWRSQAVTYLVKVVISRKRWKIETLLQTTNKKWCMSYHIASFPMTLSDLQRFGVIHLFSNRIFSTFVQQLTRFCLTEIVARSLCDSWASRFLSWKLPSNKYHSVHWFTLWFDFNSWRVVFVLRCLAHVLI